VGVSARNRDRGEESKCSSLMLRAEGRGLRAGKRRRLQDAS